jgi:hypothetical protein
MVRRGDAHKTMLFRNSFRILLVTSILFAVSFAFLKVSNPSAPGHKTEPLKIKRTEDQLILRAVSQLTPESAAQITTCTTDPVVLRLFALGGPIRDEEEALRALKLKAAADLDRDYSHILKQLSPAKRDAARRLLLASQVEVFDKLQEAAQKGADLSEQGRKVQAHRQEVIKQMHQLLDQDDANMIYDIVRDMPIRKEVYRIAAAMNANLPLTEKQVDFLLYCRRIAPTQTSVSTVIGRPFTLKTFSENLQSSSKCFLSEAAKGISSRQFEVLVVYEQTRVEKLLTALREYSSKATHQQG